MQKLKILNTREVKKLKELLNQQFGYAFQEDYAYLENENKFKIYLVTKDISKIDINSLRIDRYGLYLGERKGEQFRLSMEGTQLLAQEASENEVKLNNVIDLNEEELRDYFQGLGLDKLDLVDENKLILLRYKKDIFGCAKLKGGKIINFLPKIHRGELIL
jgi:NOL1/NOP2/fmu family ribosome biogenesis protein